MQAEGLRLTALHTAVADLMRQACAQFVLPRFRALEADQIQTKTQPKDLVTVADVEAEAWLAPHLAALVPGSLVLGEEAASRGEADSALLTQSAPVWTLDPIDGTYTFVQGREAFCSMVALVQDRHVLASWILFPTSDRLYSAGRDQGAFCQAKRGADLQPLSQLSSPAQAQTLGAVSTRFFQQAPWAERRAGILAALAPTRPTGCAGLDYCQAAEGNLAFVAMAALNPWDHAPGTLLVAEAGGQVRLNGGTYDPAVAQGALISGCNPARLAQAAQLLQG